MESYDSDLEHVVSYFTSIPRFSLLVGRAIRQAFNEVIDGARTKRYRYDQLDKEEKTYIGKKIEIIIRDALKLPKGEICDLNVDGIEIDIKWSGAAGWMIPQENINQICMLITATDSADKSIFSLGFIRTTVEVLNAGKNQDKKGTISKAGKQHIRWLFRDRPMPANFLLQLPDDIRDKILSQDGGQARINELFRLVQGVPITREALETVGNQRDTAKRARDARIDLSREGIRVLSGRYDREEARLAGLPIPGPDEFISYTPSS